jgi:hypothetical protein
MRPAAISSRGRPQLRRFLNEPVRPLVRVAETFAAVATLLRQRRGGHVMKRITAARAFLFVVVLTVFELSTNRAFAAATGMNHDQARDCLKQGGIWTLIFPPSVNLCAYTEDGVAVSSQCGGCYYPNVLDCMKVNGTWHTAASAPPPFAYCVMPNGAIQSTAPVEGGAEGGSDGSGGVDCGQYGLVSNGVGGCVPADPGPCSADLENCFAKHMSGQVIGVNPRTRSFTVMADGAAVTLSTAGLKGPLPKIGAVVEVAYRQMPHGPMQAVKVDSPRNKSSKE